MKKGFPGVLLICLLITCLIGIGCVSNEEGRNIARGSAVGAAGGALLGLAMGAAVGEPGLGMAVGGAYGAAAGGVYEYDQARKDRRAKMVADSVGGAEKGETPDGAGKRHFEDFIGEWHISIWALDASGNKITATGRAKGVMGERDQLELSFFDVKSPGYDTVVTGTSLITLSLESGFRLENSSSLTETRQFVGEYIPKFNLYNFYPSINEDGMTITGVIRSNIRIELKVAGSSLMMASTYSIKEGREVKIQEYRFTR